MLMKYGFNSDSYKLDLMTLEADAHFKIGLKVDPSRKDKESIKSNVEDKLKIKGVDHTFLNYWEIINLFNLFNSTSNVYSSDTDTLKEIVSSHSNLTKSKKKIDVETKLSSKGKIDLIIQTYSTTDLDENALIHSLLAYLPELIEAQHKGSSMVVQLFNVQTSITAQIIFYLSSLYTESYLIKPSVSSDLSNEKYLVLINLKKDTKLNFGKKISDKEYVQNLLSEPIPADFNLMIQCFNSMLIPHRLNTYSKIKTYLDGKVYEGATYQEMKTLQDANTMSWVKQFISSDQKSLDAYLDSLLKVTDVKCNHYAEWNSLFE